MKAWTKYINGFEKIGKGAFSTAYRSGSVVRVVVEWKKGRKQMDYSKQALALFAGTGKHIPQIERLDFGDGWEVYELPFYQRLTSADKTAWAQFQTLRKLWREEAQVCFRRSRYDRMEQFLERVKESDLPPSLVEDLESIIIAFSTYGEDAFLLEFSARNLAVDSNGNLILLDIGFCPAALEKAA